jgi:hypothetical protein
MKIIITESQYDYLRRIPAIEEKLNDVLQFVDPTEFIDFQDYISHVAKTTLNELPSYMAPFGKRGGKYPLRTEFRDYIVYELRDEIRKIYDSKKPGNLF